MKQEKGSLLNLRSLGYRVDVEEKNNMFLFWREAVGKKGWVILIGKLSLKRGSLSPKFVYVKFWAKMANFWYKMAPKVPYSEVFTINWNFVNDYEDSWLWEVEYDEILANDWLFGETMNKRVSQFLLEIQTRI